MKIFHWTFGANYTTQYKQEFSKTLTVFSCHLKKKTTTEKQVNTEEHSPICVAGIWTTNHPMSVTPAVPTRTRLSQSGCFSVATTQLLHLCEVKRRKVRQESRWRLQPSVNLCQLCCGASHCRDDKQGGLKATACGLLSLLYRFFFFLKEKPAFDENP